MYHALLDRWEMKNAMKGIAGKQVIDFQLDMASVFPDSRLEESLATFANLSSEAASNPKFFDDPSTDCDDFVETEDWIKFQSSMSTPFIKNNTVWARVWARSRREDVLVVFHHWGADKRSSALPTILRRDGLTIVEIALPYHLERAVFGSADSDYFISANLGRTLAAMQQAVWDGRKLIRWLKERGFGSVSVMGTSLGSWVAGLVAAHDKNVDRAAFMLSAGDAAEAVWTANTTTHIQAQLKAKIDLDTLRRVWAPLNLEAHASKLARENLSLFFILGNRDKAVLPMLSQRYVAKLRSSGKNLDVYEMNCGHYSLALPMYGLRAALKLRRFFN